MSGDPFDLRRPAREEVTTATGRLRHLRSQYLPGRTRCSQFVAQGSPTGQMCQRCEKDYDRVVQWERRMVAHMASESMWWLLTSPGSGSTEEGQADGR